MKSVYVFGPIHMFWQDYLPVYKKLIKLCEQYFDKVIGTYPDFWNTPETPREFYNRTYEVITKCNLFIWEVSSPSSWVGMEFQMAQENNIPCIGLCKKWIEPSMMIKGIPCTKTIIYYEDLTDLSDKLKVVLWEIKL